MLDFVVVVPVLDLQESLEIVLRCLEAQSYSRDKFECIIVDDGSRDGTRRFLDQYRSSLQIIRVFNPTSYGRGAARNIGWKHSRRDIVLFLDGDMLPAPGWIADYARAFEQNNHDVVSGGRYSVELDPKSGNLASRLSSLIETTADELFKENVSQDFEILHRHAALGQFRAPIWEKFESQLREVCLRFPRSLICAYSFISSNAAVRRSLLESVNGFDQYLRRGEDIDLGIRLWQAGARFGFAAGANAYHQCDTGQSDGAMDPTEHSALFYRHPYQLVALIYLWFVHHQRLQAHEVGPDFESLLTIASSGISSVSGEVPAHLNQTLSSLTPIDCRFRKEELVEFYEDTYDIPSELISEYIDRAVRGGLHVKRCDADVYFDFFITDHWLRNQTPYQEHLIRRVSFTRSHKTRFLYSGAKTDECVLKCCGSYNISLLLDAAQHSAPRAVLNIPLPIENSVQSNLKFTACWPEELLNYVNDRRDIIVRYPLPQATYEIRVGYKFECTVRELTGGRKDDPSAEMLHEYLRPMWPARLLPKLKLILKKIGIGARPNPYESASLIYWWMLENISFRLTPFPETAILDNGFGSCIDQAKLYINLCRLAAIPARECCGADLDIETKTADPYVIQTKTRGFSPFDHTWAEFYAPENGWIPVDFMGRMLGRRIVTPRNIIDPELRRELLEETNLYDRYYFGNLDPYRIYAGAQANHYHVDFEFPNDAYAKSRINRESIKHHLVCKMVETRDDSKAPS